MTTEEIIESIEDAIEEARALARTSRIIPTLRFECVPLDVFVHFQMEAAATAKIMKCGCGNCGNLIVAFEYAILEETDSDDDASGVNVAFVRSATDEETVAELERIVG